MSSMCRICPVYLLITSSVPHGRRRAPAARHTLTSSSVCWESGRCLPGTGETLRWDENSEQVLQHVYAFHAQIHTCANTRQEPNTDVWSYLSDWLLSRKTLNRFISNTRLKFYRNETLVCLYRRKIILVSEHLPDRTWAHRGLRLVLMCCLCVCLFVWVRSESGMINERRFPRRPPCRRMDERGEPVASQRWRGQLITRDGPIPPQSDAPRRPYWPG